MRYTHAIVVRMPESVKFDSKKLEKKINMTLVRKQQEDLVETLREAAVEVIELPPDEGTNVANLYADDALIAINGTALITRPKRGNARTKEIAEIVREFAWQLLETPEHEGSKTVVLEGSDVLNTGRELFVGVRKHGTNMEGAMVVARTWPDLPVVPISLGNAHPLKHYVALAADGVLAMGKSKEAILVRQKIERESTFRYKVLTIDDDSHIGCLNINERLIFRHDKNENAKFRLLTAPTQLWGITAEELSKVGDPFTRFCLLIRRINNLKSIGNS